MSSLNRVSLIGRLGKDPEVRNFQNGNRVVNIRLATSERYKDREGNQQEKTEWHSVAIFNDRLGEVAERYLKKGSLVFIEGKLETRKWQASDGTDRYSTEIVLRQFNGQLVLLPSGRDGDRGDEGGGERRETTHRERSWDSGDGGGGGGGGQGGGTYTHEATRYRHGPGAGSFGGNKPDMDDDIPF